MERNVVSEPLANSTFPLLTTLTLVLGIFALGSDELVISPILLDLSKSLTGPLDLVALSVSVYGLALGLGAPLLAPIGDRLSRRTVLIMGMVMFVLATVLCAVSNNLIFFLIGRILSGLAAGSFVPSAYAFVGDQVPFEKRGRVMGLVVSSWALSLIIGIPLGSFINQWLNWRWTFWCLSIAGLIVTVFLFMIRERRIPESKEKNDHRIIASLIVGIKTRGVLPLIFATFCNMFGFYGMYTFVGSALRSVFPEGSSIAGKMIMVYGLGFAASSFTGRIADRVGKKKSLIFSFVTLAIIIFALPYTVRAVALLLILLFLWGAMQSLAVTMLSTLLSECSEAHRGQIMGLYSLATNLAVALGAGLMGVLYVHDGYTMVALVCGIITFIGLFFALVARQGSVSHDSTPITLEH